MTPWLVVALPALGLAVTALACYLSMRLVPGSAERLRARQVEQPLAHELPYWAFLDVGARGTGGEFGLAVHVDLTHSACLELAGLDTDCLDSDALNQVSLALHAVLQGLPAHVVLQFSHWTDSDVTATVDAYRRQARGDHPLGQLLVADKAETFVRSGLRRSRLLLALSMPAAPSGTSAARGWLGRFGMGAATREITEAQHEEAVTRLRALVDQVERGLAAAGVEARPLDAAELRNRIYQRLNPTHSRLVELGGAKPTGDVGVNPTSLPRADSRAAGLWFNHQGRRRPQQAEPAEPPTAGLPAGLPWSDDQTAREQLLFSGIFEQHDSLLCDGQLLRVLTLKALPATTEPALLETLLGGLPFHCRVNVAIEMSDSIAAVDDLKRRRDQAHLLATLREKRNQEAEAQEQDVADLIDQNLRSSLRMVRASVSIVLSVDARRPDAALVLDGQTHEVKRVVAGLHGAQIMVDEYAQLDELLATLPGNAKRGRRWRRCTSENAAHLVLAWQPWTGAPTPTLLVQNGRGHIVGLDPFDDALDNPNAFMAGASGSGKSATTNYLLLNLLAGGAKALVVDVGGSYRRLMQIFDGRYFAITLDSTVTPAPTPGSPQVSLGSASFEGLPSPRRANPVEPPLLTARLARQAGPCPASTQPDVALNPFFAPVDILGSGGQLEERRLAFILAVVERMACDARRPELGNAERALLGAAVEATYRATPGRAPILSDLVGVLRSYQAADEEDVVIARGLARDLRVWVEGPAARLINRPSTLALTTELAAFDLKGLETQPQLQAVVMLILAGIIWNLVMKDKAAKKIVVFDEVWRLLESPSSARLIAELYRTSRKYRASILTISQSVEDFTSSPIANALTNNSATVYLLKHRRGHEVVAEQFHLNHREEDVFRGLEMRRGEFTEALVLHGDHHFLARVVLSPLEYWIATSHPADHQLEAELRAAQPHLSRLDLLRLLAARFPRGASTDAAPAADAA